MLIFLISICLLTSCTKHTYKNSEEPIKSNIPKACKVSESEFKSFIKNKELKSHTITISDCILLQDEWDNIIARISFAYGSDDTDKFYVNPELYEMALKLKKTY